MINIRWSSHLVSAIFIASVAFSSSARAEQLTVAFVDRAGYSFDENGTAKGFMIDIARKIASRAGLEFSFQALPQGRAIKALKDKTPDFCLLGLFKNPEREEFATFTKPIYKNKPIGVLVSSAQKAKFAKYSTLADLLSAQDLNLGMVTGFSYGKTIDDMVAKMAGKKENANVTPALLVSMLAAGHIDYMFADAEEYQALAEAAKVDVKTVELLSFKDIPEGNQRYLLCSKAVPAAIIDRLNAAIEP